MDKYNWQQVDVRYAAALASIVLSIFTLLVPQTLNDDSYLYLRTAEIFLADGLSSAFEYYSWASYSILIGLVSKLGISLVNSAFIVNAAFFSLLSFSFVNLIKSLDDTQATLWIAAVCILFYPELSEYRYLIIRDVAFWAFTLTSVVSLFRYLDEPSPKLAIYYCLLLLAATAFRIEAIAYFIFTPLLLRILSKEAISNNSLVQLITVSGAILFIAVAVMMVIGLNPLELGSTFVASYSPFVASILDSDPLRAAESSQAIFGEYAGNYSDSYLLLFMTAGLLAVLVASIANAIGIPVLLTFAAVTYRKITLKFESKHNVLLAYMMINFVIVFIFIFVTRFLPSRYSMILALLAIAFLPLLLKQLLQSIQFDFKSGVGILLVLTFVYCLFDSYYSFGKSKDYIGDSIDWLNESGVKVGGLITNESSIAYGTGGIENYDRLPPGVTQGQIDLAQTGDFLAIEIRVQMQPLVDEWVSTGQIRLVASFPEGIEPKVQIFRIER